MRLSELQHKDVINIVNGKKIGHIVDVVVNDEGIMTGLVVERTRFLLSFFTSRNETEITWSQIDKIGTDVILVKIAI